MCGTDNRTSGSRYIRFLKALGAGLAGLSLAAPAAAGVTAVFEAGGSEEMTIEYRDDDHVRMGTPDGGFVLVTDGEGYLVSREGGEWQVFAMEDFASMMNDAGFTGSDVTADMEAAENRQLRDTGRSEEVAGIQGQVHEVVMSDGWSEEEAVSELVLSDDADARAAYRGMMRITGLMGEMAGQQGLDDFLASGYGVEGRAVLRADEDWRLQSIERGDIPDNSFSLPAEPRDIPDLAGMGASGARSGDSDNSGQQGGAWLENLAEEVGNAASEETGSVADEAREETSNSVSDAVRDGIRGIFD